MLLLTKRYMDFIVVMRIYWLWRRSVYSISRCGAI